MNCDRVHLVYGVMVSKPGSMHVWQTGLAYFTIYLLPTITNVPCFVIDENVFGFMNHGVQRRFWIIKKSRLSTKTLNSCDMTQNKVMNAAGSNRWRVVSQTTNVVYTVNKRETSFISCP